MKVKIIIVVGAAAYAATASWGAVGDVISSFPWPNARDAYRDGDYVYCVAGTPSAALWPGPWRSAA